MSTQSDVYFEQMGLGDREELEEVVEALDELQDTTHLSATLQVRIELTQDLHHDVTIRDLERWSDETAHMMYERYLHDTTPVHGTMDVTCERAADPAGKAFHGKSPRYDTWQVILPKNPRRLCVRETLLAVVDNSATEPGVRAVMQNIIDQVKLFCQDHGWKLGPYHGRWERNFYDLSQQMHTTDWKNLM